MARVFIDGFESGSLQLWEAVVGASIISALSGMDGNYCVDCYGTAQKYIKKNISALSEVYIAFRFIPKLTSRFLGFYNGTTLLAKLQISGNGGYVQAYRGTTLIATGSTVINYDSAYLFEVKYTPHGTTGDFKVKVNGILDIDFSGNTTPGATSVDGIMLSNNDGNIAPGYFDNVVIDDANFPGNTRIQAIKPTASGNSTQWTPDTGSNWDRVDEVPPSDTDYNWCNQANLVDLFTFGDLQGQVDTVKCVQVQARAFRNGDPMPTKLQLGVRSGGNNYFGSSLDVTTSAKGLAAIWEADPATSQAWTVNGVNSAEFGYKSAA